MEVIFVLIPGVSPLTAACTPQPKGQVPEAEYRTGVALLVRAEIMYKFRESVNPC